MGSRTVASTFATQLQIRSFNLLSLGLIIAWSFSPIGGQSILHILSTPLKASSTLRNIGYFNSRQQSYSAPAGTFKTQWFAGFTVLLGSAILEPLSVKTGPMDAWGNVKIPFYSSLALSSSDSGEDGWVQATKSSMVYSSLFGIPISGLGIGNTTLTIESTYISLSCSNMSTSPILTDAAGELIKTSIISTKGPFVSFENATAVQPWAIGYKGMDITAYIWPVMIGIPVIYTHALVLIAFHQFTKTGHSTLVFLLSRNLMVSTTSPRFSVLPRKSTLNHPYSAPRMLLRSSAK